MHDDTSLIQTLAQLGQTAAPDAVVARGVRADLGRRAASGVEPLRVAAGAVPALLQAGRVVASEIANETKRLSSLDERWHAATSQAEADAIASAPLAARLEAGFALEGVESLIETTAGEAGPIEDVARNLASTIVACDAALRRNLDCLCTLADGDSLIAWRRSLPLGMDPPWWLDGTLEARARTVAMHSATGAARLASAFAGQRVAAAPRLAASTVAAAAIGTAAGYSLAAAASPAAGITTHAWRHPSRPFEAVLWVPARFANDADLRIVFQATGPGVASRDLVGEVIMLGGLPAVVRECGEGQAARVEATWPAHAVADSIRDTVALTDGRGDTWIPAE
jgi:hypothetical protein